MADDCVLFLTDTHAGTDRPAWTRQTPRGDLLPLIAEGAGRLARRRGAGLIVHGGDLTDAGDLDVARRMTGRLGLPVAACLGNHDLMAPDAAAAWQAAAIPGLALAPAVVPLAHVDLVLVTCAWTCGGRTALFWDGELPVEALGEEQAEWLDAALAASRDKPACLVIHAPPDPLPPRLTGLDAPLHGPPATYAEDLGRLLDAHPRVRLVLAGHNHATCAVAHGERVHLSTSSAIEVPFEVRLVRFGPRGLGVETLAAIARPPDADYDETARWVNGLPEDRTVEVAY